MPTTNMRNDTTPSSYSLGQKLWFRLSLFSLVLILLFFICLPIGARYYLRGWVLENGADEATIKDIDINLFTGKARLKGVDIRKGGVTVFSNANVDVDIGLTSLLKKKINIQKAFLDSVTINIEQYDNGDVRIGSYTIQPSESPSDQVQESTGSDPWVFLAQELDLSNVVISYKQPSIDMQLIVKKGLVKKITSGPNDTSSTLFLQGALNGAPLEINLTTLKLLPNIDIEGTVAVNEFELDTFAKLTKDTLKNVNGLFTGKGAVDLSILQGNEIDASYNGTLGVSKCNMEQDLFSFSGEQIQWQGNVHYLSKSQTVNVDGKISGNELRADASESDIQAKLANLNVESKLTMAIGEQSAFEGVGDMKLEGILLVDLHKDDPLLTLKSLDITAIDWKKEESFTAEAITIDSLAANYIREMSSEQETIVEKQQSQQIKAQEEVTTDEADFPPVRISNITLTGTNRLAFTDKTLSSPLTTSLEIQSLQVGNIDTSQTEQPFSYTLEGMFDEITPVKVRGSALVSPGSITVSQETEIRNYSMQRISPYVVEVIGSGFNTGQLDFTSKFKIVDDTIDSQNNIVLKNIEMQSVNIELQEQFNKKLPVPIGIAFAMLEDKKGRIDLDIPVTGKFSELHVGTADIITTALSKAIITGVTPYLAYMILGPTGALVYAGVEAGKALVNTDFPTLEFDAGVSEISPEQSEIIAGVGKKIVKEKDQAYTICSKVSLWELDKNIEKSIEDQNQILRDNSKRKQLLELGMNRTRNVKTLLLEHFDIQEERLLMCDPGLNFEKNAVGTIEILK